ncbi:Pyrophosphate-energized vacuolar membrane proton pump 1 [Datura stramonium]|uniref:H(+)-exporting diphosphatase n=1 Tax=Datura stramonium TaxID=4076 RepID=A0ABS8TI75_DATST|nr:Pyrophosphate-energized vacuolar membrane proton pump 1 [Datura stramonium]
MGLALLPDLGTEIVILVCAIVGIVFSLFQWYIVLRVKVSSERGANSLSNNNKNGYEDYLIEEEEGINDQNIVAKCADIQNAIFKGKMSSYADLFMFSDLVALRFEHDGTSENSEDFHHNLDYSVLELENRLAFTKTFEFPLPIAFHLQEKIR